MLLQSPLSHVPSLDAHCCECRVASTVVHHLLGFPGVEEMVLLTQSTNSYVSPLYSASWSSVMSPMMAESSAVVEGEKEGCEYCALRRPHTAGLDFRHSPELSKTSVLPSLLTVSVHEKDTFTYIRNFLFNFINKMLIYDPVFYNLCVKFKI